MSEKITLEQLEERVKNLESVQTEGIDMLIKEVQNLYQNDQTMYRQLQVLDVNIASLNHLLVLKNILTDEEVVAKRNELVKIINNKMEQAQKEAKKKDQKMTLQDELDTIQTAASRVDPQTTQHPKDAFMFGG